MTSLTLSVPDETETPKRLSEYGAVTVARTLPPAVQTPIRRDRDGHAGHARGVRGRELCPPLFAVASDGASLAVVGAPESAAARAPERAASEMSM